MSSGDAPGLQRSTSLVSTASVEGSSPEHSPVIPAPGDHYKLLVEDARALGDRREAINNLFVGAISLLAGGQAYLLVAMPTRIEGLIVTLLATAFGLRLCTVWQSVLGTYKALLDFRFHTLKLWEAHYDFPSIRRYYVSEDILYGPLSASTDLSNSVPAKWVGKAGTFVNMYVALPKTARRVFVTLAFLQILVFAGSLTLPHVWPAIHHWLSTR